MERLLSPWASIPWFQAPQFAVVQANTMGPPFQACPFDPNRAVLIMSPANSGQAQVSIDPAVSGAAALFIGSNGAPMILTQAQHGVLCQSAWYVGGSSVAVYVITLALRDWPQTAEASPDDLTGAVNNLSRLIRELTAAISGV